MDNTIIIAIISSGALSTLISALFSLWQTRRKKADGVRDGVKMILYDRIKFLGKKYIERGYVTTEELDLQTEEEKKALEEKAEELKGFLTFVKETLGDAVKEVKLSAELGNAPAAITSATGMSFEMEKYMRRVNPEMDFPSMRILELNPDHDAVKAMQNAMVGDTQKAKDYAKLLHGQALLLADLPLPDPMGYAALVCKLMK